jgi:RimJ/RimL family protein N-acetyltransferase
MTPLSSGYQDLDARIAAHGRTSVWIGDQVHLRTYEPQDADLLPLHPHSADQRSAWMIMPPKSKVATRATFQEAAERQPGPDTVEFSLVIARCEDNLMVGGCNISEADRTNGTFSHGVGLLPEHKGNGFAAEAVVLLLRFMFDERRFQKCEAHVNDYNTASLSLHRKLGFTEEGRLRRHLFMAGEYRDEYIFGMTAEEFHQLYPKLKPGL